MTQKIYIIPHNYRNNGRVFNMVNKKAMTKALCWFIPFAIVIFKFTAFSIDNKFFFLVLFGVPPALAFCAELDEQIKDVIIFWKNRKIIYNLGKEKCEDDKGYKSSYEQAKIEERNSSKQQ